MGKVWNKFILLMWKNYKQQIRHPIQTALEILAPILFAVTLVVLRSLIPISKNNDIAFMPFEPSLPRVAEVSSQIVWSPSNPVLEKIVNDTVRNINEKNGASLTQRSFPTKSELNLFLTNDASVMVTFAAIEFEEHLGQVNKLEHQTIITLRFPAELRTTMLSKYDTWKTKLLFPEYTPGPREEGLYDGGMPSYNREGFLTLQQELAFSIIKHLKKHFRPDLPKIYLQRFPHVSWTTDKLMAQIRASAGMIFLFAYIYTAVNIVKTITYEKETQLKEVMKIMGLPNWLHWAAWTLKFVISLSITSVLMVIVLETGWNPSTVYSVFTRTDPNILLIFLLCFSCATISFCFLLSACFSSASTAATFTGLFWFLSYVPFYFMDRLYHKYNFIEKIVSCLCSNTAMAYGFKLILQHEEADLGIQWKDVLENDSSELTLGHIMLTLLFDSVLYFALALYVGSVFPGNYGVPQKWYYPITYTYWFGTCGKKNIESSNVVEIATESEHLEKEPTHLHAGVKIKGLCKKFSGGKLAVDNLTLNMYKDQISIILGHNGAGKTTTISTLIGMYPPSFGSATVEGYDIRTDISGVRRSLGLCPQNNVLFDELTVCEHLYFYSRLKGMREVEAYEEIAKYVQVLELESKINANVSTLSGGMKRKLSVAIAFCGNSEVVMLDEPTAGMDPSARRLVWDLLQTEKKGRTIVLTTHFMDEADVLGDRIAIISNGKLQCCGTSFFLKKKYGAGYHLIIDTAKNCSVDSITRLLRTYIPDIKVSRNVGSELVYLLNEEFSKTFEQMLYELETNSKALGINTYGISLTTLEEVFMKVGAEKNINTEINSNNGETKTFKNNYQNLEVSNESLCSSDAKLSRNDGILKGWRLWFNQIQAMYIKRILSLQRNWILLLIQLVIPVMFVVFIMIIMLQTSNDAELPKLTISLKNYTNPVTLLSTNKNNIYTSTYIKMFAKDNNTLNYWENEDLNSRILETMKKKPEDVRYKYIAAATMHKNHSITGWFNNIPFHSAPLTLQLILNAILHKIVSPEYNIQFVNHPLPYAFLNTKLVSFLEGKSDETRLALNISFAMAFVSSFYVLFYIRERANKSKHLQFVSGMNVMPFWIPSFSLDILTFTITSLVLVCTMAPFQISGFSTAAELGRMLSLLLSFGVGMLPIMYLSTFLFDNPSTAYTRITFFNIFSGVGAYLFIHIIKSSDIYFTRVTDVLENALLVFPHFSLSHGINTLTKYSAINSICNTVTEKCVGAMVGMTRLQCKIIICSVEKRCCRNVKSFYGWSSQGILRNISILIVVGIVCFAILLCIEYKIFHRIRCHVMSKVPQLRRKSTIIREDTDVALEREKVQSLTQNELNATSLVMQNVTKYYGDYAAVKGVSLIVHRYECFGLLGVNGAGKTTTFKMMTGDIIASSGNAWIYGLSIDTDMKAIQRLIGYCPQFDALFDELTVRETLLIFGLIKGIPRRKMKLAAEILASDFDFYQHLDKRVGLLSGGDKRKLSTSLALIGDPMIVYLDEPTTGMDPATKRYLWDCICKVRDSGKCIVLTSHSMEECEALCTRLAIMVNGRLMCLGSTQHLKNKFLNTYTLTIKIKRTELEESNTEPVEIFVRKNFQHAYLREKHKELLIFSISGKHQRWSEMFGLMESAKQNLNIDDYSLGQCSLEQVFLRLTKYQTDDEED